MNGGVRHGGNPYLNKMKLPTEHRNTEKKDEDKRPKKKTPRELGPEDITVHTRGGGPTVQLCGESNVACKWINGEFAQGTKYKDTIGKRQNNLALVVEERSCNTDLKHQQFRETRLQGSLSGSRPLG